MRASDSLVKMAMDYTEVQVPRGRCDVDDYARQGGGG